MAEQPGKQQTATPADIVAEAVGSVPGVAGLHSGMFGEVGTYLPGRRVSGVRLSEGVTEVHVTLHFGAPVRQTAAQIRDVVATMVGGRVDVTVEDVVAPGYELDTEGSSRA
ncbi:Asp23/Gls24 family envelope stress response protein [Mycolicibacterium hippocampi]|uniref:Asp23/Gls24 family envelope stress response protein n=1 Tax=Mycolicibacterium hippocampi TaxID=659824 RepID=A0A850PY19_9MYCO|nr:hypothetical protein [Mycolicibacterium hippocampi]